MLPNVCHEVMTQNESRHHPWRKTGLLYVCNAQELCNVFVLDTTPGGNFTINPLNNKQPTVSKHYWDMKKTRQYTSSTFAIFLIVPTQHFITTCACTVSILWHRSNVFTDIDIFNQSCGRICTMIDASIHIPMSSGSNRVPPPRVHVYIIGNILRIYFRQWFPTNSDTVWRRPDENDRKSTYWQ